MPYCNECGTKLEGDARFCSDCGVAINIPQGGYSRTNSTKENGSTGSKISLSGAILALVCFFLPWLKACDASLSGFDLVTKGPTQAIREPLALILIAIPLCAGIIIWCVTKAFKGEFSRSQAGARTFSLSLISLAILGGMYIYMKIKLKDVPFDVFSYGYTLSVLSFISTCIGGYLDKGSAPAKEIAL